MGRLSSIILGVFSLILMWDSQAHAFSYSTCLDEKIKWDSTTVTVRASAVSFPGGEWRNALQTAITRFNLNPSKFRYDMTIESGSVGRGNGQNEVWGSTNPDVLKGHPAIAYTWWTCYWFFGDHVEMDEVDVIFDYGSPWIWSSSEDKSALMGYGGSGRPFRTTAIHELGHGLILNHVNSEYNVMGKDFEHIQVNGRAARAYVGEDTSDGAVFLYGTHSPAREDLGVVHWKYSGTSEEYSDHTKTRLYGDHAVLSNFIDAGETRYRVTPGQQIRAEFTYENNGANTQSNIEVGFYISTNDLITTEDQRIGGMTVTLSRDSVFTTLKTLTIPSTLQSNQNYWLGVVVDDTGAVGESPKWNNATYIPIRTE